MLVKIKLKDRTLEFNSKDVPIAVLMTDKDREAIDKMPAEERMILSCPISSMAGGEASEIWRWAYNDWQGATLVSNQSVPLVGSENRG